MPYGSDYQVTSYKVPVCPGCAADQDTAWTMLIPSSSIGFALPPIKILCSSNCEAFVFENIQLVQTWNLCEIGNPKPKWNPLFYLKLVQVLSGIKNCWNEGGFGFPLLRASVSIICISSGSIGIPPFQDYNIFSSSAASSSALLAHSALMALPRRRSRNYELSYCSEPMAVAAMSEGTTIPMNDLLDAVFILCSSYFINLL